VRVVPERDDQRTRIVDELARLYDLTAVLRDECPWDRKQTQQDIITYTLEEVYELADALRAQGGQQHDLVRGELGDLLFQVYFLARVAEQAGWYDLGDVAAGIREKLIRRHPHIFGEASAETAEDVKRTWEEVKRSTEGREGIFHEVPESFPATLFALKLQQRAGTAGFDWEHAGQVLDKIREELAELEEAMKLAGQKHEARDAGGAGRSGSQAAGWQAMPARGASASRRVAAEVGDLLFAGVNLARKLKVDPELELRAAGQRFRDRVEQAERLAEAEGRVFEEIDLDEQEAYFQKAKRMLREGEDR
jgi:XTP/dITP diphosphohydrolase/tetrapyrrole methylase family protein/MazG family protein/ATP diphosphatase